ncbi:MAG: VOC family protein [Chloroflexi bacterium]|nr:VOC family protein [Chloroflexota bacterium]
MFNRLTATCLLVHDLDKSIAFYRDTLGLEVEFANGNFFVKFKLDGTPLMLFEKEAAAKMLFPKEHITQGGGVLLAFQVDDLQKTCAELKSKGVEIFEGPKATAWGQTVAYFKDPDGNVWEVSAR